MDLASLEIRIARSENLPVLPQAVSSVLRLADDPNATPKQIERAIERDPAITAKVLRVANSAYYGGNKVPSVARAVSFLGLNAVRSVVVSVAFQQMLAGKGDQTSFSRIEYWRHSLAVATGCKILGRMKMPMKAEELYCAGMMHDLGMLIMDRFMPMEFEQVLRAARESRMPLHMVERFQLGFGHAEVGGLLADKWNLTPLISHAIRFHHEPIEDGDFYETTLVVGAANTLAHQAGFTNSGSNPEPELESDVFQVLEIPEGQFESIKEVMVNEVVRAQDAFQISG